MKNKINYLQIAYFTIGLIGIAFIAALQMKLNIGIGPWDGFGRSISYVTGLKVGDISMLQSSSCLLITFLLLKKNFKVKHLLTLFVGLLLGIFINFFFYVFFANLNIESYFIKLVLFVLSIVASAYFVSIVQTSQFVSLPLEDLCQNLADKYNKTFAYMRQAADILCVAGIIIFTLIFKIPLTLREGTIISMIIFAPFTGVFMPRLTNWLTEKQILPLRKHNRSPEQA